MAVAVTTIPVIVNPFSLGDSRAPEGLWRASLEAAGDVSGGFLDGTIIFSRGRIWSVEGWSIAETESGLASLVRIAFSTGETINGRTYQHEWAAHVQPATTTDRSIQGTADNSMVNAPFSRLGWFVPRDAIGTFGFRDANDDTKTFELFAWGYVWSLAALQVGSPLLPEDLAIAGGGFDRFPIAPLPGREI